MLRANANGILLLVSQCYEKMMRHLIKW